MMQEDSNGDFEIVDKKMTSLLVSDGPSPSSSSVLTNVAPPAALPSFLSSPLPPAATGSPIPPPSSVGSPLSRPGGAPVPPPGKSSYAPPGTTSFPPPVSTSFSPSSTSPGPGVWPGVPPYSASPMPGSKGPPPPVAQGPPSFPPMSPSSHSASPVPCQPPAPLPPAPQATFLSQPPPPVPVTSQPHPPHASPRNPISVVTKGHSRHHSFPLYVPTNPIHNPPPPPTPPCLVVHKQEQVPSFPLSKSHTNLSVDTTQPHPYSASIDPYDYRNTNLSSSCSGYNSVGSVGFDVGSVGYGYAYPPYSGDSVDACSAVDLGSPGVEGPPGRGWFGWIRGTVSNVGFRVAEKAKTSMDTMITTLDPQMKEFIHSGGDVDIIVASDKEVKIGAVREAFQVIFGKATVSGVAAQAEGVAAQPVGCEAALMSAEERINFLRSSGRIHPQQPIVAIENFILELTPDSWYDLGLLLLDDPAEDILLQTYTQMTPVPPDYVNEVRTSTPADYPHKNTGFSNTVGKVASQHLQVHHTQWQETLTGVPRRDLLVLAARSLAGLYKSRISHRI